MSVISTPDNQSPRDAIEAPGQTTKDRLLDAAETVFHDKGFSAARVSDIVDLAGVAQGTFYLHFRNKQAILVELIDGFFSRLVEETLGRHPVKEVTSPDDLGRQLNEMWKTLIATCRARPQLTRIVLVAPSALPPGEQGLLTGHFERIAAAVALYVKVAAEAGHAKPLAPDLFGWVIVGLVERAIYYAVFVDPGADIEELARDLTAFELSGLLSDTGEREADHD